MYLMILKVILIAILIFVVGPILFLFWSILLLCLGRHPSQNPHHFTPDIGQLPRSIVNKIPLMFYIPPPPDQPSKPVTIPSNWHSYPPKSPDPPRRFRLSQRRATSMGGTTKTGTGTGGQVQATHHVGGQLGKGRVPVRAADQSSSIVRGLPARLSRTEARQRGCLDGLAFPEDHVSPIWHPSFYLHSSLKDTKKPVATTSNVLVHYHTSVTQHLIRVRRRFDSEEGVVVLRIMFRF
ncbi:hypothetical protein EI94DRAFT_1179879 [Lactarius quietus]|nr:hypothetical protein EI94DRAFT_1179879 [Lactarius quietus]